MRKHLKKIRKSIVTKEELIADAVFMFASLIVCALMVFLFDIHHSFYDWPITLKFIFKTYYPYLLFIPIGTVLGFFIIKLILFGYEEEKS